MPSKSSQKAVKTAPKRPTSVKKPTRAAVTRSSTGARLLQTPTRVWYKPLTWRNHKPVPAYKPLPKARHIFWRVCKQLWQHKRLFGGVVVVYGLLNLLLVRGLSGSSDLQNFKSVLDSLVHGFGGKLASSLASFAYLLSTSGSGNAANSGMYQTILFLICSLAFIWAFRQTLAKHAITTKQSFYEGMYPLIPFILVFLLIGVQLLPLAIGGSVYSTVFQNGIAVHLWEKVLWLVLFLLLGLWSLRMITATCFALYIVTLPGMSPMRAYRSARELVYGRRLLIWRKLIFLPIALFLAAALIEVPLILFLTPLAVWVFFALSMLALPLAHGYLYNLYRDML
jgi:hypothetical protein